MPDCRFCGEPAVAHYAMSAGCICYPNDREQDLCAQHENRATPLGRMVMVEDYVLGEDYVMHE